MSVPDVLLKTQQVADALGISVSTLKRWVDAGQLAASRTVGRHRLIPLGEATQVRSEEPAVDGGPGALGRRGAAGRRAGRRRGPRAVDCGPEGRPGPRRPAIDPGCPRGARRRGAIGRRADRAGHAGRRARLERRRLGRLPGAPGVADRRDGRERPDRPHAPRRGQPRADRHGSVARGRPLHARDPARRANAPRAGLGRAQPRTESALTVAGAGGDLPSASAGVPVDRARRRPDRIPRRIRRARQGGPRGRGGGHSRRPRVNSRARVAVGATRLRPADGRPGRVRRRLLPAARAPERSTPASTRLRRTSFAPRRTGRGRPMHTTRRDGLGEDWGTPDARRRSS